MVAEDIFDPALNFEEKALEVFHHQSSQAGIYADYIKAIKVDVSDISRIEQIPFLPISFFKTHVIKEEGKPTEIIFTSSGTSGQSTSSHYITDLELYIKSFTTGFSNFYGDIKNYCFLALLPSYLERNGSSLVYMCDHLIKQSQHPLSGFYLDNMVALSETLRRLKEQKQKVMLIGVTYALLDLAEKFPLPFPELVIVETGGMKGKRKEMVREEVHDTLIKGFDVSSVHSEYGMTELLSQAWSKSNGIFQCPTWMRIYIRDINDPLMITNENITGAINVIDLANIHSCSFIATDDLGRKSLNGSFEVVGRLELSELMGCNLMVE